MLTKSHRFAAHVNGELMAVEDVGKKVRLSRYAIVDLETKKGEVGMYKTEWIGFLCNLLASKGETGKVWSID